MGLRNEIRFAGDVVAALTTATYGFVRGAIHEVIDLLRGARRG